MSIPESGQLVLTLLNELIAAVKTPQPLKLDGSSLTLGFVYSQLPSGDMVNPTDYANPWAPAPGKTPADGSPESIRAAFMFAQKVDNLLKVTKDNSYIEFPGEKKVSITYQNIIDAMQPLAAAPQPAALQSEIAQATKVLYTTDADGNILDKTPLYKKYLTNSSAYAKAVHDFDVARDAALANPVTANSWPMDAGYYQTAVDQAYDTFKTEGADKVEAAIAVRESVGISIEQTMVMNGRKLYEAWLMNLSTLQVKTPYTYADPSNWSDPDAQDDGWMRLQVTHSDYSSVTDTSASSWSAGASGFFGFFDSASAGGSGGNTSSSFANDATGLSIDMEYGVVSINRPWLLGDLFYLKNWYAVGYPKNAISNGTLDGQDSSLFPMIPVQFLCIRNVKITASDWKSDGHTMTSHFSGGGGFNLGFISFGASYSTSTTHTDFGWSFDGATLSLNGVQIVAYLSEIVPPCAPLDDPGLNPPAGSAN